MHQRRADHRSRASGWPTVDPRLYGSFVEHMGRCVYTGIYEPGHPQADARRVPPRRGRAGPRARRADPALPGRQLRLRLQLGGRRRAAASSGRRRLDLAWRSIETNQVGRRRVRRPGPRGVGSDADDGGQPRHPRASTRPATWSSTATTRPARTGRTCAGPTARRTRTASSCGAWATRWTGPWQIGHKTADEYGRLAAETAKAMRLVDPTHRAGRLRQLQPRACRRSARGRRRCSAETYDVVDYVSLHSVLRAARRRPGQLPGLRRRPRPVHRGRGRDRATTSGRSAGTRKRMHLSFDEWNVWYQSRFAGEENLEFERGAAADRGRLLGDRRGRRRQPAQSACCGTPTG